MISAQQLDALDPQTRQAVQSLLAQVQQRDHEIAFKQALIDKLTHEMAILKRMKFAATSERFASTLSPEQRSLLEETLDTDIHELDGELQRHRKKTDEKGEDAKQSPKRAQLPAHLPRRGEPLGTGDLRRPVRWAGPALRTSRDLTSGRLIRAGTVLVQVNETRISEAGVRSISRGVSDRTLAM